MRNYIGTKISKFLILEQKRENNKTYLYCKCEKCGKEAWVALRHLKNRKCCDGKGVSSQFKPSIPTSRIVNGIELLEMTELRDKTNVVWKCKCFCGKVFYASLRKIKDGKVKSCGCSKIKYTPQNIEKAVKAFKEKNLKDGTSLLAISHKILKSNTSGTTGVVWRKDRGKWIAQIEFQGKRHFLGSYYSKQDAIAARKAAEEKFFKPVLDKYKKRAEI